MTRLLLGTSVLALALPLTLPLAGTAAAQTTVDDQPHAHDEIVSTGVLGNRNIDEIITNISVLDRDEIVSRLDSTLGDTLRREPGVSTTFFGAGASRPVLRGLGSERVLVLNNGIGVIDVSAASPDHQVIADPIDAQRVEVLRGPAALAYGGQAIGGVVNVIDGLIAREPLEPGGFSVGNAPVDASAFGAWNSAFDGVEAGGIASTALGPLQITGSASFRDFNDYDIPDGALSEPFLAAGGEPLEEDADDDELLNSFVETQTLALGVSYATDRGWVGVSIRDTNSEYGLPGPGEEEEEEEGEPGEAGEEEGEENPFIDLDQTRFDLSAGLNLDGPLEQVRLLVSGADYEHIEFEAPGEPGTLFARDGWEGRLEGQTRFGPLVGAVGLQYVDTELEAVGEEAFLPSTDSESFAAFVFQRYERADGVFGVEGGLRVESTDRESELGEEADFTLWSGSLGLHYHPAEPWFFGVEGSYTERAPNESELFANGVHIATRQVEIGNADFDPETGYHLEGTARWDTGALRVGGNLYYTVFDDFTTLLPGALPDGTLEDEGFPVFLYDQRDADFFGGEIYLESQYSRPAFGYDVDWRWRASVDWVEGEFDEAAGVPDGDVAGILPFATQFSDDVPFLPPVTLNLEVGVALESLSLEALASFADAQNDVGVGQLETDEYVDVELRAAYDFGGFEVFGQVRNLFDEDIRFATSTLRDFVPAPGRNFRLGLRVDLE